MKKLLLLAAVVGLFVSCRTIMPDRTEAWLDGKNQTVADVNISGKWDCGDYMAGGWGTGIFSQDGSKFKGTMGPYNVNGVVDGKTVYMVIESGTKLYTAKLEMQPDGRMTGKSVYNAFVDEENAKNAEAYNMVLKRMGN